MSVYSYKKFSSRFRCYEFQRGVNTLWGKIKGYATANPRIQQKVDNLIYGVLIVSREGCYT